MTNIVYCISMDQKSIEKLIEASAAEAEAVSAAWRAAKEASAVSTEEGISDENESGSQVNDKSPASDDSSDDTDPLEPDVRLHPRAV